MRGGFILLNITGKGLISQTGNAKPATGGCKFHHHSTTDQCIMVPELPQKDYSDPQALPDKNPTF